MPNHPGSSSHSVLNHKNYIYVDLQKENLIRPTELICSVQLLMLMYSSSQLIQRNKLFLEVTVGFCLFQCAEQQFSNSEVNLLVRSKLQQKHCKGLIFSYSVRIILLVGEDNSITKRDQVLPTSSLQQYFLHCDSVAVYYFLPTSPASHSSALVNSIKNCCFTCNFC